MIDQMQCPKSYSFKQYTNEDLIFSSLPYIFKKIFVRGVKISHLLHKNQFSQPGCINQLFDKAIHQCTIYYRLQCISVPFVNCCLHNILRPSSSPFSINVDKDNAMQFYHYWVKFTVSALQYQDFYQSLDQIPVKLQPACLAVQQ